jgi:phenylacetate-CoA ligase
MLHATHLDSALRSAAYGIMVGRDGFKGWQVHRQRFRELVKHDEAQVARSTSEQLTRLIKHAFETVPHYNETWSTVGFKPSSGLTISDLAELPFLTKDTIKYRKTELVSRRYGVSALHTDYTGGTTGTHTAFYRDRACSTARFGRQWGILELCGYRPGTRRGLFWRAHRDLHTGGSALKRRFRRFGHAQEVLSATTVHPGDMEDFYRRLVRFRPKILYGYPSAAQQFAQFLIENELRVPPVERVICTAELLTDAQRRLFSEVFGAEVFDLYCSREQGCVAFECSRHNGLHVDAGSVVVEIVRDGRPARPGERGEIVITDLLNYGMPFVRYATGDLATVPEGRCECGLSLPRIQSLDGRAVDTLARPDGAIVPGVMLAHLFEGWDPVRAVQFIQDTPEAVELRVVLEQQLTDALTRDLEKEVRRLMGDEIVININVVPDIPPNPHSGKHQEVISRLGREVKPTFIERRHGV